MGEGNEELGRALLKAFLFALTQQETLPAAILFYNAGAAVTCEGSASLEDLQALQSQGVEILTCGTCLNYYGLTEKLRVGEVTNMYVIAENSSRPTASSAREPIKLPGHPQDDRAILCGDGLLGNIRQISQSWRPESSCRCAGKRTRAPYFTKYGALAA